MGQGTTFKIYFPRVQEAVDTPVREARGPSRAGSETVLLVEDDAQVSTRARHILETHGYTVMEAEDGEQALEICRRHQGPIPLLVTDVVMPRMSGKELARRLVELRKGVKVLILSGYTTNAIVHHGVLEKGLAFLQKPFTPDALVRKVREVLDQTREMGRTEGS